MTVLILEDDINRITQFKRALKDHKLYITDDANEAINFLKKYNFDYIFLDHDLGGLQNEWDEENCGMVVAKYINKHKPKNDPRIIIHSLNTPRAKEMQKLIRGSEHIPFVWTLINK